MAISPIQFQQGLSLNLFLRDYGIETKCCRALYKADDRMASTARVVMNVAIRGFGAMIGCTTSAGGASTRPR